MRHIFRMLFSRSFSLGCRRSNNIFYNPRVYFFVLRAFLMLSCSLLSFDKNYRKKYNFLRLDQLMEFIYFFLLTRHFTIFSFHIKMRTLNLLLANVTLKCRKNFFSSRSCNTISPVIKSGTRDNENKTSFYRFFLLLYSPPHFLCFMLQCGLYRVEREAFFDDHLISAMCTLLARDLK